MRAGQNGGRTNEARSASALGFAQPTLPNGHLRYVSFHHKWAVFVRVFRVFRGSLCLFSPRLIALFPCAQNFKANQPIPLSSKHIQQIQLAAP
jgi:hypothetical protein